MTRILIPDKTKESLAEYRRGYEAGYRYAMAKKKMLRALVASIKRGANGRQTLSK